MPPSNPYKSTASFGSSEKSRRWSRVLVLDCLNLLIWLPVVLVGAVVNHKINTAVDPSQSISFSEFIGLITFCIVVITGLLGNLLVIRDNPQGIKLFLVRSTLFLLLCAFPFVWATIRGFPIDEQLLALFLVGCFLIYYRVIYRELKRSIAR